MLTIAGGDTGVQEEITFYFIEQFKYFIYIRIISIYEEIRASERTATTTPEDLQTAVAGLATLSVLLMHTTVRIRDANGNTEP